MQFEVINSTYLSYSNEATILEFVACAASGALYLLLRFTGFACLYSCCYRSRLRAQYDLEESPCADCLVHCCCEACALCQEYRELKNRGFDMGIGMVPSIFLVFVSFPDIIIFTVDESLV